MIMAKRKKQSGKSDVLNVALAAKKCGISEQELRLGGAAFFAKIAMAKPKLVGPIVAAATASGAKPEKFLALLDLLATELRDGVLPEDRAHLAKKQSNIATIDAEDDADDNVIRLAKC
jgi:hypothetical protein